MSNLQFKSRTGTERGKQKVFFSCHPDDFDLYFKQLKDEVLQIVDCVVYYYPPGEDIFPDEDYYQKLKDIQLFIMPVTERLLQGNNRTLDIDFPFVQAQNIPILPIQCEKGLEDKFSEVCGHRQLLNKTSQDETAIPYEEKLTNRLQSALLGEELVSRVREAFDTYLFLSYRKMDRAYAGTLMRKIHQIDLCWDVAIWYDERLVLGEDFDEGILSAMEKSKLVLLAVTPNLLAPNQFGETNYVMGVEYLKARELERPVLPIELVPTDRQALQKGFPGLPGCIDASDDRTLEAALAAYLKIPAGRKREKDPLHEFLIGLAYLNGIDMEVNRQKGLVLITGAAEAGLIEAIDKLREMYLYADGVERDISQTIYWTDKLTQVLEENYQNNPTEAGAKALAKALWDLGDYLNESEKSDESEKTEKNAISVYSRMCMFCESLLPQENDHELRRMSAIGHAKLASLLEDRYPEDAEDFYRTAIRRSLELYKEGYKPARTAWDLAMNTMRFGNFLNGKDKGKKKEVLQCYANAETLFLDAIFKSESDQAQSRAKQNLAVLYQNVGELYASEQPQKAISYVRQAIEIYEGLYDVKYTAPTLKLIRDLGGSHAQMGRLFFSEKKYVLAATHYLQSVNYLHHAYQSTGNSQDAEMLRSSSSALKNLYANLETMLEQDYMPTGNWEKADACCRVALCIVEELWGDSREALPKFVNLYNKFGFILANEKQFEEALKALTNAQIYATRYAQEVQTEEAESCLSDLYIHLGNIYLCMQRPDDAEKQYNASIANAVQIYRIYQTPSSALFLADRYDMLGRLYRQTGQQYPAEATYADMARLCQDLFTETAEPVFLTRLTVAHQALGDLRYQVHDLSGAKEQYTPFLKIASFLMQLFPDEPDYASETAVAHEKLASVSVKSEREAHLRIALSLWSQLNAKFPEDSQYFARMKNAEKLLDQLD